MTSPSWSPEDVFLQALRFDFSAQVLVLHVHRTLQSGPGIQRVTRSDGTVDTILPSGIKPPTMVAAMVCEAFCVELYLKTIYAMEQMPLGDRPKHGLDALFQNIPRKWKDRLRSEYRAQLMRRFYATSTAPATIDDCLAQSAEGFVKWRYSFEEPPPSQDLGAARMALSIAIIKVKPEWEDLRKNLETPPTPPTP